MLESRIKTKQCPLLAIAGMVAMAAIPVGHPDAREAGKAVANSALCQGSGCAFWVWDAGPDSGLPRSQWYGYCGLIQK